MRSKLLNQQVLFVELIDQDTVGTFWHCLAPLPESSTAWHLNHGQQWLRYLNKFNGLSIDCNTCSSWNDHSRLLNGKLFASWKQIISLERSRQKNRIICWKWLNSVQNMCSAPFEHKNNGREINKINWLIAKTNHNQKRRILSHLCSS